MLKETLSNLPPLSPSHDPWEAYMDVEQYGKMTLTNIEFTTTHLCNMRCSHCAVGYTLTTAEKDALPIELLLQRLDEIPTLRSLSITGGEPMLSLHTLKGYVIPLLKYARERGVRTQINSNLTLPYERYELIIPYLDVLHISHNWGTVEQFAEHGFAQMERKPSLEHREKMLQTIIENSKRIAQTGVMVSAETMLNGSTLPYLESIHKQIVEEMGCARHEVHPMYPSDFASNLKALSLNELREAYNHLLDIRDEKVWMLFGTFPFYHCSDNEADHQLLQRVRDAKNVTVRNDPDGRSRLNINIFTGEIIVTDFGDEPSLGNVQHTTLQEAYDTWSQTKLAKSLSCHCPSVKCLGPNVLVKNSYYEGLHFLKRKSRI